MRVIKKIFLKSYLCFTKILYLFKKKKMLIKKYKNKYQGKRVFIVATGPSLLISDLELIKNEYTISVNSIVNLLGKTEFCPDFYLIQDLNVLNKLYDKINDSKLEKIFIGLGNSYHLPMNISKKNCKLIKKEKIFYNLNSNYHYYDMCFRNEKAKVKFSKDFALESFDGFTVTYSAIQLAYYLGFSEIYLIGCDSTYGGHFDEISSQSTIAKPIYFKAYEKALEFSKSNNFKIYNATRGGMLEVFERVKLEEVIK